MANMFPYMSAEVVEFIVDHLDLSDIRALRFASRDVSAKVTGSRRFKSFCSKKNVELRVSSLKELTGTLSEPGPQSQLEHLTVTGVLYVTKGLERVIREKTKPASLEDPCSMRRDDLGNNKRSERLPATLADLDAAVAQLSDFRCLVREAEEAQLAGKDVDAMVALFNVVRTCCKASRLTSLTLDVAVYREKSTILQPSVGTTWRHIWEVANYVFSTSVQAWKRSTIRILRLDVFSEIEACSIQAYDIAKLQDSLDFGTLHGLKALALSLSNRVLPLNSHEIVQNADEDDQQLLEHRSGLSTRERRRPIDGQALQTFRDQCTKMLSTPMNVIGVANWLQQIPDLEELQLHNYLIINCAGSPIVNDGIKVLEHVAKIAPLPKLKKLVLRGSKFDIKSIMTILRNSPDLESISLEETTLVASNGQGWETVFAHLTSPTFKFINIYLDNIFDETRLSQNYIICCIPGTSPKNTVSSGGIASARPSAKGYNAFKLNGREDVLRGIGYWSNPQWIMGSVQNSTWMEFRRRQNGPPGRF